MPLTKSEKDKYFNIIDYNNCITNFTSSIERYYSKYSDQIKPRYKTIKEVDDVLDKKEYKNVIIILFDAFGLNILKDNLKEDSYLYSKIIKTYNSTYPPTTVGCTTAIETGFNPCKTCWLGWSGYFKEIDTCLDYFTGGISFTGGRYDNPKYAFENYPRDELGERIEKETDGKIKYLKASVNLRGEGSNSLKEFKEDIINKANSDGMHYMYCYWNEPDSFMHRHGTHGFRLRRILKSIEKTIKELESSLKDSCIFITSDHSQIDVKPIYLYKNKELTSMLKSYATIDSRTPSFFVKDEYKDEFVIKFNEQYSDKFILLSKEEVIERKIFGPDFDYNPKYMDFIGDYTGFAIDKYFMIQSKSQHKFKGHHAGLTKEEMEIYIANIITE